MTRKRKQQTSSEEQSAPRRWAQVPLLMDIGEPAPPSELSELERATKRALKSTSVFLRLLQAHYFAAITDLKVTRDTELLSSCREIRQRISQHMVRFLGTMPQVAAEFPNKPWSDEHVLYYASLTNKQQLWGEIAQLAQLVEQRRTTELRAWYRANNPGEEVQTATETLPTAAAQPKKAAAKRQRKSKAEKEEVL